MPVPATKHRGKVEIFRYQSTRENMTPKHARADMTRDVRFEVDKKCLCGVFGVVVVVVVLLLGKDDEDELKPNC